MNVQVHHIACAVCAAFVASSVQAATVSTVLSDGGSIAINTDQIYMSSFGDEVIAGTQVLDQGIQVTFGDESTAEGALGSVPAVYRFAEPFMTGDLYMRMEVPLAITPGDSFPALQIEITGNSHGSVNATTPVQLDFQYHLIVNGTNAEGAIMPILDQIGDFSVDADFLTATPFSASGFVAPEFAIQSLQVEMHVLAVNPPWPNPSAAPYNGINYAVAISELRSLTVTAVPEPATWALMGLGLAALGLASRQQRQH